MTHAFVLLLYVVGTTGGDCHVVTNHRILVLPSCDISPGTLAKLTENPVLPPTAVPVGRSARRFQRVARPLPVASSPVELKNRLAAAEEERVVAVSQRIAAERERDAALRTRDAATRELEAVRRELAALRATIGRRDRSVNAASSPASRMRR